MPYEPRVTLCEHAGFTHAPNIITSTGKARSNPHAKKHTEHDSRTLSRTKLSFTSFSRASFTHAAISEKLYLFQKAHVLIRLPRIILFVMETVISVEEKYEHSLTVRHAMFININAFQTII